MPLLSGLSFGKKKNDFAVSIGSYTYATNIQASLCWSIKSHAFDGRSVFISWKQVSNFDIKIADLLQTIPQIINDHHFAPKRIQEYVHHVATGFPNILTCARYIFFFLLANSTTVPLNRKTGFEFCG